MTIIQDTLRLFGITRCYKGFQHTAYAIFLAVQEDSRLEAVTKDIYMATAPSTKYFRFFLLTFYSWSFQC